MHKNRLAPFGCGKANKLKMPIRGTNVLKTLHNGMPLVIIIHLKSEHCHCYGNKKKKKKCNYDSSMPRFSHIDK